MIAEATDPKYDRLTTPTKSFFASLSTMPLRPVVKLEVPDTRMPPAACVIGPLTLIVAFRMESEGIEYPAVLLP